MTPGANVQPLTRGPIVDGADALPPQVQARLTELLRMDELTLRLATGAILSGHGPRRGDREVVGMAIWRGNLEPIAWTLPTYLQSAAWFVSSGRWSRKALPAELVCVEAVDTLRAELARESIAEDVYRRSVRCWDEARAIRAVLAVAGLDDIAARLLAAGLRAHPVEVLSLARAVTSPAQSGARCGD